MKICINPKIFDSIFCGIWTLLVWHTWISTLASTPLLSVDYKGETDYLQLSVCQNALSGTNSKPTCSSTNLVLMIAVSFAIVWHHCDCSQWVRHRLEIPRRIYLILTYVKCFQKHAVKLLLNVENSWQSDVSCADGRRHAIAYSCWREQQRRSYDH